MNTERIEELRGRIRWLAIQGKAAARMKDKKRTLELMEETLNTLDELNRLTQDKGWKDLADEGQRLYDKFTRGRPQ